MKFSAFVLCFLAVAFAHLEKPAEGFRLIRISDEKPAFWVPFEVIEALALSDFGFIDVTDRPEIPSRRVPQSTLPTGLFHQDEVNTLKRTISTANIETTLTEFSSFRNRYYTSATGVEGSQYIFDKCQAIASTRNDITCSIFTHANYPQFSVIARIEGNVGNDTVILGSHLDSIAPGMPTGSAPGSDDDGSGSMGVMEIFRAIVASGFRPENPLEFQWFAAEEVGLLGSGDVAADYARRGVAVRAMMQLDMIAYTGKERTVGIVTDFVDPDTIEFARKLVDEYLDIGYTNTVCGYGCSDHASYTREGYRSTFPFEAQFANRNPLIHTPRDDMASVDLEHCTQFSWLGLAFAIELSYV